LGISILELVLRRLRQAKFTADVAYPGQKFPEIKSTVAAVHIEKVDRANMTVTVEVNIISPADLGGTACEVEALRATDALRWAGAVCIQNGCSYDGVSQVYIVSVLATFTGITEEDTCTLGPGFTVSINERFQTNVISFAEEEVREREAEFSTAESAPVGISEGKHYWKITLEELIPAGNGESADPVEPFELRVETDAVIENYYYCKWTSIQRSFTREGLRKIRKGIAMAREVEV
jgi:hypothetical protein